MYIFKIKSVSNNCSKKSSRILSPKNNLVPEILALLQLLVSNKLKAIKHIYHKETILLHVFKS